MRYPMPPAKAAALCAMALAACAAPVSEDAPDLGSLSVALATEPDAQGRYFVLDAELVIRGEGQTIRQRTSVDDGETIDFRLPAGAYNIALDGWTLLDCAATDGEPNCMPASAPRPVVTSLDFEIEAYMTTVVTFEFAVAGEDPPEEAQGDLNVGLDVTRGFRDGDRCSQDVFCESKRCVDRMCAAPTCDDGVRNGDEEGPDCGGSCDFACPGEA